MDTIGERLRSERKRLSLSQEAFAALGGASKPSQVRYENGERSPDGVYLSAVAAHGADVLYILTGTRSAASQPGLMIQSMTQTLADPDEFLQVPVLDVALAAGDGRHNYGEEVIAHLAFRKDWLRGIGVSPSAAVIARAEGESMYPTIRDGDLVLIDRGRAEPPAKVREPNDHRPAPIYALLDGDGSRVKRLELAAPGVLALASDNPSHQTEYRPVPAVSIIGRVMWWGHTNRE